MSKINQIQQAILSLGPGEYQKMMDEYLVRKYGFNNISSLGSHSGTNKTTRGTPDTFIRCDNGKYIMIAYGAVTNNEFNKVKSDILSCLDVSKTGIDRRDIARIICCHTSTNFSAGQNKELHSLFESLEIIGLSDVSFDLLTKFQMIAKDYLGISVDTNQIFDVQDFIRDNSKNRYSTSLDMQLLCRESELSEIETLLKENDLVVITAPSGIGKTRFALEVGQKFSKENGYILKIIRSNGEPIYEDLKTSFTDECDYFVIVDDANQLVQLNHLLLIRNDTTRHHKMKVLITVRDYAFKKVLLNVTEYIKPVKYELKPLSNESIVKILSDNLEIKNTYYSEPITSIAKGNIRLAIMAGQCAIDGGLDQINNVFDIFDFYFSNIIEHMSKNEILVATIAALFESFEFSDNSTLPFSIALDVGIDYNAFREHCYDLHQKEVVDIYENKAMKFGNQNLGDYLFYYVFIKEKWINISHIIERVFVRRKERVIYLINTLLRLFNTSDNVSLINSEIKISWKKFKGTDNEYDFILAFYPVISDEALLYIKKYIDNLTEKRIDLLEADFEKNNFNESHDKITDILGGYKYLDGFDSAITLAITLFEKNSTNPKEIKTLFCEKWGIDYRSNLYEYSAEIDLMNYLIEYHRKNDSDLSATLIWLFSKNLLNIEFSEAESGDRNTLVLRRFSVIICNGLLELRSLAIKGLTMLLKSQKYCRLGVDGFLSYPLLNTDEDDIQMFESDINTLAQSLNLQNAMVFSVCQVIDHMSEIGQIINCTIPKDLQNYKQNKVFMIYKLLNNKRYTVKDWEKREDEWEKDIVNASYSYTEEVVDHLWKELAILVSKSSTDHYQFGRGIDKLFWHMSKHAPLKFLNCCETYVKNEAPFWSGSNTIVKCLMDLIGFDKTRTFILEHDFRIKYRWLVLLCSFITDDMISKEIEADIMLCLDMFEKESGSISNLNMILRINNKRKGFLINYITRLNLVCQNHSNVVSQFLQDVIFYDEISISDFVRNFDDSNIRVLCDSYILALYGDCNFDYEGKLLSEILQFTPSFVVELIFTITDKKLCNREITCLDAIWHQDNYNILISSAIETLFNADNWFGDHKRICEKLLNRRNKKLDNWNVNVNGL